MLPAWLWIAALIAIGIYLGFGFLFSSVVTLVFAADRAHTPTVEFVKNWLLWPLWFITK